MQKVRGKKVKKRPVKTKKSGKAEQGNRRNIFTPVFVCALMLTLPLAVSNGYYNITKTKSVCFYVLACAFVAATVLFYGGTALLRKQKPKFNKEAILPLDIAMLCFAGTGVLSALLSEFQKDVWIGEKARYQGAVTICLYAAVYFCLRFRFRPVKAFVPCAAIGFCAVCIFGVLNCFDIDLLGFYAPITVQYKPLYISTIGNINFYSCYLCLLLPLVLYTYCTAEKKWKKVFYLSAVAVGGFGMMVTGSESFVLGFSAGLAAMLFFCFDDAKKMTRLLIGCGVLLVCAQAFVLISRFASVTNVELSLLLSYFIKPYIAAPAAVLLAALYFLAHRLEHLLPLLKRVYTVLLITGVVTVAVLFLLANTVGLPWLNEVFFIDNQWGTNRGMIWKQCLALFKEFSLGEKLFGIGPEALQRISDGNTISAGKTLDQAHNEYLQYLLTGGLCGLLAYLSIPVTVIVCIVRKAKQKPCMIALFCPLVAYWAQAIVNIAQPFTAPIMFVFVALIGALTGEE